jgi:hypothetical protein
MSLALCESNGIKSVPRVFPAASNVLFQSMHDKDMIVGMFGRTRKVVIYTLPQ